MNLMLHLIKKDLQRGRWALLCWALSFGYLLLQSRLPYAGGNLRDYFQISAMAIIVIMAIALIADVIQADHPTREDAHWRTLPVSAGRLVAAKLLLIGGIFVLLPALTIWFKTEGASLNFPAHFTDFGMALLVPSALAFSLAATASCTRNVVQCLMLWLGLVLGTTAVTGWLDSHAPVLSRAALARLGMEKAFLILGLSVVVALAVILNQYFRRRLAVSVGLLLTGAVGAAMIGTFWGYFYFYHA